MQTLVSTDWLARHLGDPDLVVLDCSVRTEETETGIRNHSGFQDYAAGHIPTAGFADLTGELSDRESAIEFAPPSPEDFCAAMGRLGVGDGSRVVLYDNSYAAWAAKVWWMLRWVGFDDAALLDGGLQAWTAEGWALSTELPERPPRRLSPRPRSRMIADRDEVRAAIKDPEVMLIDTLPPPFFAGEMTIYDRPGHIPTAVNIPGGDMLGADGKFRADDEIAGMFPRDRTRRAITYCGGGILASLSAFAMTRLGFRDVAVYTASLQEWAADPANPMTLGAGAGE